MKKLSVILAAMGIIGSSALFGEDVPVASAEQGSAAVQTFQDAQADTPVKAKAKRVKKTCAELEKDWAGTAQKYTQKAQKATAAGDSQLAALYTKCALAAEDISKNIQAMDQLKSQCSANQACRPDMKDGSCGPITSYSCMKKSQKCADMSQKMLNKANKADKAGNTDAAASMKAASEMELKMSDQFKSLSQAADSFESAKNDLKVYKKSLKAASKSAQADSSAQ